MSVFERAAVIGLGLIGGSVARDLSALGVRVLAFDTDTGHLDAAVRDGIVHDTLSADLAGVGCADLIVVAVPVDAALDVLRRIAPHAATTRLITDVGSTKERIVSAAHGLGLGDRFVGSHPMAGDHRSGWDASRAGLFQDAQVYLCPVDDGPASLADLAAALWRDLGARPLLVSAVDHDQTLAWTSHLPHMVSTALALALARQGVGRDELGSGGRDVTRLAGSSPDVWTAIARDNGPAIDAALAAAEQEIAGIRRALNRPDDIAMRERFAAARAWFLTPQCSRHASSALHE